MGREIDKEKNVSAKGAKAASFSFCSILKTIKTHHDALAVDDGEARDALADEEVEGWRFFCFGVE